MTDLTLDLDLPERCVNHKNQLCHFFLDCVEKA